MSGQTRITLFLQDGQDVDELIEGYIVEHPEDAKREFLVIGWMEEGDPDDTPEDA